MTQLPTINEFGQYVWSSKKDGTTGVNYFTKTPIDHHADAMDALRYAVLGLGQVVPTRIVRLPGGVMVRGR